MSTFNLGPLNRNFNVTGVDPNQIEKSASDAKLVTINIDKVNDSPVKKQQVKSSRGPITVNNSSFTQVNIRKMVDASNKSLLNESYHSNRSTTTAGGALGNKIGLAVSRIIGNTSMMNVNDDDEIPELIQLIEELNQHQDLTVRLTNQSKLCKILDNKDTKKKQNRLMQSARVGNEMRSLGGGFQSKLKLEMKGIEVDPEAKAIMDKIREDLEMLQN